MIRKRASGSCRSHLAQAGIHDVHERWLEARSRSRARTQPVPRHAPADRGSPRYTSPLVHRRSPIVTRSISGRAGPRSRAIRIHCRSTQVRSVILFFASAVLAIAAVASLLYTRKVQRDFSAPTTMTMGVALGKGAFVGKRASTGQSLCWVSYEFTTPDGRTRRNWRFWEPACGTSRGRPVPIRYVVANPDVNRPEGSEPWDPSSLLFFASGVVLVMAVIFRRSERDADADWRGTLRG